MTDNQAPTIKALLDKLAKVSVERGRLCITSVDGESSPRAEKWIQENTSKIFNELSLVSGKNILFYDGTYSTGNYKVGVGGFKRGGVHMEFTPSASSAIEPYVIFNAELTRTRTTKAGKRGDRLKGNKFNIGKRSNLYKFWKSTGLKIPSLSDFSRHLGNLKPIALIGEFNNPIHQNRLCASALKPLEMTHKEIALLIHNSSITHPQAVHKPSITLIHNKSKQSQVF